jgi:hypothetical protein
MAGDGSYHVGDEVVPTVRSKAEAAQQLGLPEQDIDEVRLVDAGDLVVFKSGRGVVIPVGGGGMYEVPDASKLDSEAAPAAPEPAEAAAEEPKAASAKAETKAEKAASAKGKASPS